MTAITSQALAFFILFRERDRKMELVLVRDRLGAGDWTLPCLMLGDMLDERHLEMALGEFFSAVSIASMREIDTTELRKDIAELRDSPLYACEIGKATSRLNAILYVDRRNPAHLPRISDLTRKIISLPSVQSRLA